MSENTSAMKGSTTSPLLAISILALAASIGYFTYELSQFIRQIPDILENVRTTSEIIEPALSEVEEIRSLIEPILVEVKAIREQIPNILQESENIRTTIPPILNESAQLRKQLPAILESTNQTSTAVTLISNELNAYQPIANEALVQLDGTRKEIPGILDRTDAMIDRAKVAAREASSGVVTGALGGLLTAPFRLVGSLGSNILDLNKYEAELFSNEEITTIQELTFELLQNGQVGDIKNWSSPTKDLKVEIKILKEHQKNDLTCRDISFKAWDNAELKLEKSNTACKDSEGKWTDEDNNEDE